MYDIRGGESLYAAGEGIEESARAHTRQCVHVLCVFTYVCTYVRVRVCVKGIHKIQGVVVGGGEKKGESGFPCQDGRIHHRRG